MTTPDGNAETEKRRSRLRVGGLLHVIADIAQVLGLAVVVLGLVFSIWTFIQPDPALAILSGLQNALSTAYPGQGPPTPSAVVRLEQVTVEVTRLAIHTQEVTREVTRVVESTPGPATIQAPPTAAPASLAAFDDFSSGLSPIWSVTLGNPIVVDDMLTSFDQSWLQVGDASWRDYSVAFEADASNCWSGGDRGNIVALRMQDADNFIAFMWLDCESAWFTVRDGVWAEVPNTRTGSFHGMPRLLITVEGQRYAASVDGQRVSSVNETTFSQGYVGLQLDPGTKVDNFSVSLLSP